MGKLPFYLEVKKGGEIKFGDRIRDRITGDVFRKSLKTSQG